MLNDTALSCCSLSVRLAIQRPPCVRPPSSRKQGKRGDLHGGPAVLPRAVAQAAIAPPAPRMDEPGRRDRHAVLRAGRDAGHWLPLPRPRPPLAGRANVHGGTRGPLWGGWGAPKGGGGRSVGGGRRRVLRS